MGLCCHSKNSDSHSLMPKSFLLHLTTCLLPPYLNKGDTHHVPKGSWEAVSIGWVPWLSLLWLTSPCHRSRIKIGSLPLVHSLAAHLFLRGYSRPSVTMVVAVASSGHWSGGQGTLRSRQSAQNIASSLIPLGVPLQPSTQMQFCWV